MSEMVEQVAIAMCNHAYLDLKVKRDWVGETRGSKDKWRAMAQAAIEAMREPTEKASGAGAWALTILYAAGRVEMDKKDVELSVINCIWDAMIRECLDPGAGPEWSDTRPDWIDEALK